MFIRYIIDLLGNFKKTFIFLVYDLEFTTPCWSTTSSLLHLNQLCGGGGRGGQRSTLNTPMAKIRNLAITTAMLLDEII